MEDSSNPFSAAWQAGLADLALSATCAEVGKHPVKAAGADVSHLPFS